MSIVVAMALTVVIVVAVDVYCWWTVAMVLTVAVPVAFEVGCADY